MTGPSVTGTRDPSAADDAVRAQLQLALGAHYVLGREVGGGGMARVYVARDDSLGRDVAVKVFRPELAAALSAERFAREIRVAAALQEPHIVPVLAAGTTPGAPPAGGLPYYTMPFVRGESLRARLDRGGALPPAEAVAVLGDVLRALAHAHAHGVVHRDIKPENILLVAGGPSAAAVVTDFGIAKAVRASSPTGAGSGPADPGRADAGRADARRADRFGTAITGTGVALGTPAYMAPEQAAADPAVDERADLYAWGLVAYEALAGRHPFAAHAGAHAMVLAQLTARPAPLAALLPELPAPVADVVMRCLEKDPAARPPRATDALAALDLPRGWRAAPARRPVTAHAFRLSDAVLRRLDRATLDPRLLGGAMQYLENDAPPGVLLFCVHGLGHEGAEYAELLATVPHRAVAPTLFGFEPDAGGPDGGPAPVHPRVPLAVEAHLGLLRALLDACVARLAPERVVLVGFSSGADLVLRLLAEASAADAPRVDGCLALGPEPVARHLLREPSVRAPAGPHRSAHRRPAAGRQRARRPRRPPPAG
jgi:serine/threonine protein kinase